MRIPRGTLWQAVLDRTHAARESGALQPIQTDETFVEDAGVRFVVRSVSTLARKSERRDKASPESRAPPNPFLPPDPALTVGDVSPTHVGVLNKFPVVEHHLLIVTREFVPQDQVLDADDFAALARCLAETDGLCFYNGGKDAGASQTHKHLQLVPLPIGDATWDVPMEALFDAWAANGMVSRLLRLPFKHAFALLEPSLFDDPLRAAERVQELYGAAMETIGAVRDAAANDPRQAAPYNFLVTRRWMLAVPRSKEKFDSISISALGFAGSLFVRDDAAMARLRDAGPMNVLRAVAV